MLYNNIGTMWYDMILNIVLYHVILNDIINLLLSLIF